ncbi:MAG: SlyX family protein [Phycisphaerales bacterium]|nr:SlyX family protein [Phycisphaerales bacterium]
MSESRHIDGRVERLEEALSYAQHEVEQLSGELRRAFAEIDRMQRLLARLEGRLNAAESRESLPDPLDDLPPHSIG